MTFSIPQPLLTKFTQSKIGIWGLGREGLSTYRFLRALLPEMCFYLYDDKSVNELDEAWQEILANPKQAVFHQTAPELPSDLPTLLFKTPGIPLNHPFLEVLDDHQVALSSNTQLFLELVKSVSDQVTSIGVTGTKGKSTTSSVIYQVLKSAELPVWLAGNIGKPALDLWPALQASLEEKPTVKHYMVLELSAHQLHDMTLSPKIAVIQNIVPEHLDYYPTFADYIDAKAQIVEAQTEQDFVIYNPSYEVPKRLAENSAAKKLTFTTDEVPILLMNLRLKGKHNFENVMPAVVIAQLVGIDDATLARGIAEFQPLPHRLEYVATINDVEYYNDSLATVPDAVMAALQAFEGRSVVLIAGGFDRTLDYTELGEYLLKTNLRGLVLFPTTGEQIEAAVNKAGKPEFPVQHIKNMDEAVKKAAELAQAGDVVLLSPAAASYNLFKDFADRGDQFKAAVRTLQK